MNSLPRQVEALWSIVLIELTSCCNFSCSFCPSDIMKRKKGVMPQKLWRKILNELAEKRMTHTVFFHVLGEPLLNRDIFNAIALANSLGLSVSLYTNGALLDKERSSRLLDVLNIGRIVLSMQDISPDNFNERCHNRLAWQEYIERLQNFVQLAEKRQNPIPIQIHCMLDIRGRGWNLLEILRKQQQIQLVYDQWRNALSIKKRERINVFNPDTWYPLGNNSSFFVKHAGNWDNQLIEDHMEVIPKKHGHCDLMTDTFAILQDGTCTYCCDDYEGELNLGNAYEDSLENIYYGEKATGIRNAEKYGQFIEKRCQICRGTLVNKKTGKPIYSRNLFIDYYIFREHLRRYGLRSSLRKIIGRIRK